MAVEVRLDPPPAPPPAAADTGIEHGELPDELREQLEGELTHEARRILKSDELKVEVRSRSGSILVTALIVGKVVADVGAFFAGVREIRGLFPDRIRDRVTAWLGPDVPRRDVRLIMKSGLEGAKAADEEEAEGDPAKRPVTAKELSAYAALSLAVLLVVAALTVLGALALT